MKNLYARLPHVRNELNAKGSTAEDDDILRAIARASRAAETMTHGRQFHSTIETRYFSGDGTRKFLLGKDLLSITTFKIADTADQPTAFENTMVAATDYTLWPRNAALEDKPYRAIVFNPDGQYSVAPKGVDNIEIAGKWGYSEIWEAVVIDGTAVTGTLADTGADLVLTTSVSVAGVVEPGDVLKIGDEQDYVSVVAATNITVTRAINGTTGAAHSTEAISLRRFPADLERAVAADAARWIWRGSAGYPDQPAFREQWPAIQEAVMSFADPAGVF